MTSEVCVLELAVEKLISILILAQGPTCVTLHCCRVTVDTVHCKDTDWSQIDLNA